MSENGSALGGSRCAQGLLFAGIVFAAVLLCLVVGGGLWASLAQADPRMPQGGPPPLLDSVTGHVNLQGRPAPPAVNWVITVEVQIYSVLTPTIPYSVAVRTTDQYGNFDISGIGAGFYNITVKGIHTLRLRKDNIEVLPPGTSTIVDFGTLQEGDANNDNKVNALDAALLGVAYWGEIGDGSYDPRADFDGNGRINARDSSLLATNYWLSGAD